jgi:uncharacterized SAM-binding protein YcdF (DUF218 family)
MIFKNQRIGGYLLVALGIVNILYFITCFIVFKMFVNFSGFFLILGTVCVLLGIFKVIFYENNFNKLTSRILRVLKVFIYAIAVSFIFIEGCIFINANIEYLKKPDYIMILGSGISGKSMLLVQLQRVEEGLKYIKANPDIKVIVSGGQGTGEDISEAEAMRIYLVQHGVKNENIIKEEKSKNTIENMKYTSENLSKIDGRKDIRLAIVTSNFHVFRAKFLAKRFGFEAEGVPAPVNYLLLPNYCVREYFSIIKSFILTR